MTELTFLIELLLNHDLPKATKDLVATRIKEVEEKLISAPQPLQRAVSNDMSPGLPVQNNAAVQAALAAREAAMSGKGDVSMFKAKPK